MSENLCEGCALMPPNELRREVPVVVAWLAMGAVVREAYKGRQDTVGLELDGEVREMAKADYEVARRVWEALEGKLGLPRVVSPRQVVGLMKAAGEEHARMGDERAGKRGVVMLKDRSGSGYWRMVFPARFMDKAGAYVDVTPAAVKFEALLEYETVFVQRLHDWESYYVLERLKAAGKRVVYDMDDDIFSIERDNPASRLIGRDEQMAAAACMKLADCVTTTTAELQKRLATVMEGKWPVVVPNAIDMEGRTPTPLTGSPDEWKRIFWQGGDAHGEDWTECAEAVDAVMGEREDVRVVIMGFLPPVVLSMLKRDSWRGRVEFLEFRSPETYFEMMRHVRAEVGLAPLKDNLFNRAKSELKFVEYSAIGMPTVASRVGPYEDAIDEGVDGFLVSDAEGWFEAISTCLDDKRKRLSVLEAARRKVRSCYDVRKVAATWRNLLLP